MFWIIFTALFFLAGLLFFERTSHTVGLFLTKPVISTLFIATALIQNPLSTTYYYTIIIGLSLCLIGDVCLIFMNSTKMFLSGLVAFLSGHLAYIFAFAFFFKLTMATVFACIFFCLIALFVFQWLKANLGNMKIPVIAYISIITIMIICAVSVFSLESLPLAGRTLVFGGALLFYVSDLFVARNKFIKAEYTNRLIGLPLYYLGQYLIAFSTGYLG